VKGRVLSLKEKDREWEWELTRTNVPHHTAHTSRTERSRNNTHTRSLLHSPRPPSDAAPQRSCLSFLVRFSLPPPNRAKKKKKTQYGVSLLFLAFERGWVGRAKKERKEGKQEEERWEPTHSTSRPTNSSRPPTQRCTWLWISLWTCRELAWSCRDGNPSRWRL